jgi:hypothetical protein
MVVCIFYRMKDRKQSRNVDEDSSLTEPVELQAAKLQ